MIFFPTGEKTEAGIVAATKIALKFVIAGMAWIIITDVYLVIDPDNIFSKLTHLHIFKGVLFITACGVFLFYLILSHQKRLREKEDEIRAIFSHNPLPMWSLDQSSLKIITANPAACSLFGYTHQEMSRMKITDLSAGADPFILERNIRDTRRADRRIIFSFNTRAGSMVQARVFSGRSRFKGSKTYFVSILDVSSQLKTEKELEIINTTLKERVENEKEALIRYNQELVYRLRQAENVNEELIYVNEELQKANRRLAEQNFQLVQSKDGKT